MQRAAATYRFDTFCGVSVEASEGAITPQAHASRYALYYCIILYYIILYYIIYYIILYHIILYYIILYYLYIMLCVYIYICINIITG